MIKDAENVKTLDDLLAEIKNGDYGDFDLLLEMYRPLIEGAVSRSGRAIDADDVRQISVIALFNAVRSFDPDRNGGITFGLYAKICINNALKSEFRKIDQSYAADYLDSSFSENEIGDPEEEIIKRENFADTVKKIRSLLTPYEYEIFRLYLLGYSYKMISEKIGRDENSVGNALSRTKNKIKNHRFD